MLSCICFPHLVWAAMIERFILHYFRYSRIKVWTGWRLLEDNEALEIEFSQITKWLTLEKMDIGD